jgi:hypothetical protein
LSEMAEKALDIARAHAPSVRLHRQEPLWPCDVDSFVAGSSLRFEGANSIIHPIDMNRLGAEPYGVGSFTSNELTRPHDEHQRPDRLPIDQGFAITLDDEKLVKGRPPTDADVYESAPVYYDYHPGHHVSYWFFYGGSALPKGIVDLVKAAEADAVSVQDVDQEAQAREALRNAQPGLYAAAAASHGPGIESFSVGGFWDKVRTLVKAVGSDAYLCHEGDWERVIVFLNASDEAGEPLSVRYDAHGLSSSTMPWASTPKHRGRLLVYSGWGSHASFPTVNHLRTLDEGDEQGFRWETWDHLEPVDTGWYGFGGAWGKAGSVGDLTGPLGPSPYKDTNADGTPSVVP